MNDLQILIVTLFLGGITYWCVRYLARIFSKASASSSATSSTSDNNGNAHQKKRKVTPEKPEHAENKEQASNESKVILFHIWISLGNNLLMTSQIFRYFCPSIPCNL